MKKIRAAAKVSRTAKLQALTGSTENGKASSAPSMARAGASRTPSAPPIQASAPMGGAVGGGGGMSALAQPTPQMQVKRGGSVKAKRGLGGRLMGGMPGGMGMKKDEEQRARGGAVMKAGAGSGEGRLEKTAHAKRK